MSGITLFRVELTKLRRTKILFLLLLPIIILWVPMIWNADISLLATQYTPEANFLIQSFLGMAWFMYPASLVILTVLLTQIERTNKAEQKMLSLPLSPVKWCMAKFLVLLLLAAFQMACMVLGYFVSAVAASGLHGYDFVLPVGMAVREAVCLYLASIPLASVFWMIAVCIRTPVFSAGVGLASIVPSVLIMNTKAWAVYPACYGFRVMALELDRLALCPKEADVRLKLWIPAGILFTAVSLTVACIRMRKGE